MWWISELFSCLKFLAITGNDNPFKSKRVYEFIAPGILTTIVVGTYLVRPNLFIPSILENLAGNIFQFMVFVVPFHLAALGAFATFNAAGLDEKLSGVNAQLRVWSNSDNDYFFKDLTLRQYVSLLFGYLCSIGIFYILLYLIISSINLHTVLGSCYKIGYKIGLSASLFFILHYIVLTIYAITFLFDKVNKVRSV